MPTQHSFILILSAALIFLDVQPLPAQNQHKVDSLLTAFQNASSVQKVEIHLDLSAIFLPTDDKKSMAYLQEAYALAEKINFEKGIGRAQLTQGLIHQHKFELKEAKEAFKKALHTFSLIDDQYFIAKALNNIGNNFLFGGQYKEALPYYEKALPIFKKMKNDRETSDCLGNIGVVNDHLGNYTLALDFYLQSLALAEAANYKEGIGYNYSCIAGIHGKLGNQVKSIKYQKKALGIFKALNDQLNSATSYTNLGIGYKKSEKYDSSLFYLTKALGIFNEIGNRRGKAFALHNMGGTYLENDEHQKALASFHQSNELGRALGLSALLPSNYRYIANIFLADGQLDSARWYAEQGLQMAEAIHAKNVISQCHLLLSDIYEGQEQYAAALRHHRKHLAYQDTLLNQAKSRQLQELEIQYETEKKEQQIALQESMLQSKNNAQLFLMGMVVLVLVASGLVFKINQGRQITKRKLLDEQLKNERLETERVKELEQLKSRFYANIAHEFRTPLTLILGPTEQIRDQPENIDFVLRKVKIIEKAAEKLLILINQLLDLSKLEANKLSLNLVQTDFVPFIKGIAMSFESLAADKNIKLELNCDIRSLNMFVDPDQTDKIFYNLISNAFKFTDNGGTVAVDIGYKASYNGTPSFVEVKVSDNGIGISKNQLPKIFDRFYQVEDAQDKYSEGTGIGLALTKELVNLHKGWISVESNFPQGTSFIVDLPVEAAGEVHELLNTKTFSQEAGPAHVESTEKTSTAPNEKIVLLIEDNFDVRKFIKDCLAADYQILEASEGKEGVALAIQNVPDLIISDVMMPEMDGFEACKILKSDSLTSHIPIILLTAKTGLVNKIEGLNRGADDYLAKPFHRKELLARIKNLIYTRKLLREKFVGEYKASPNPETILPPKENQFIKKVRAILDMHLDDSSFGIENLCKEAGVSRTQLHRKIKALTSLSTSRFIRLHKLQKAISLLKDGQYNISEVSYMTGFSSPSYFTQCFQEELGYSPSEKALK